MKKPILKLTVLCLSGSIFLTACTKESIPTPRQLTPSNEPSLSENMRTAPATLANDVSVSPYGFLILNNGSYANFIYDNSATDILAFHSSIGFTSQASVSGQADNYIAPSIENGEYMFNTDGIMQIGQIVIRGINTEGYLLAMPAENLTSGTYEQLASKEFDPSTMVKLRVGAEYFANDEDDYDFEGFVRANIGHDGTFDPIPPTPAPAARFWGWGKHKDHWHYYVLWIPIVRWNLDLP